MFKWVLNTSLNRKEIFYVKIFNISLFKFEENRANDVKESRKHISTQNI